MSHNPYYVPYTYSTVVIGYDWYVEVVVMMSFQEYMDKQLVREEDLMAILHEKHGWPLRNMHINVGTKYLYEEGGVAQRLFQIDMDVRQRRIPRPEHYHDIEKLRGKLFGNEPLNIK